MSLSSQLQSKSSMLKKASRTSPDAALNAALPEKLRTDPAEADMTVASAKCMLLFALPAAKKQQFLSNRPGTNPCTAVTATNHAAAAAGK